LTPIDEVDADGVLEGTVVEIDQSGQEYLFRSGVLTDDVVPLVAALSAQDTGDARQAIKYLRKAGELADKHGDNQVSAEHAREAQALVEREAVVEAMREMTTQAHLALAALTALEISGDAPVRAKPIYGVYKNVASRIDADKLGQRRFKDHLRELDRQGIAEGEKVTAGSIGGLLGGTSSRSIPRLLSKFSRIRLGSQISISSISVLIDRTCSHVVGVTFDSLSIYATPPPFQQFRKYLSTSSALPGTTPPFRKFCLTTCVAWGCLLRVKSPKVLSVSPSQSGQTELAKRPLSLHTRQYWGPWKDHLRIDSVINQQAGSSAVSVG